MSVQSEINRINTAVSNQTALLDQALELIAGKAAGGGGDAGGSMQIAKGTFQPTNKNLYNNPISVSGVGFTPKAVIVSIGAVASNMTYTERKLAAAGAGLVGDWCVIFMGWKSGSYYFMDATGLGTTCKITIDNDGFTLSTTLSSDYVITANGGYRWIAIA